MIKNEWIQVDGVILVHHDYQEANKKIKLGNNDELEAKCEMINGWLLFLSIQPPPISWSRSR